jgi:hypothetical protein
MAFETDDDVFPVRCPHCKKKFYETIGRLKAGNEIQCPAADCRVWVAYEADQFLAALEEAREHLEITAVSSFASVMQRKPVAYSQ